MREIVRKGVKLLSLFLIRNKITALTLLAFFIFADIVFIKISSDYVIFSVLVLYIIFIKLFKIYSNSTFLLCLGLLVVMSIDYLLTQASVSTEKAAVWFILFLVIGVIQGWKE